MTPRKVNLFGKWRLIIERLDAISIQMRMLPVGLADKFQLPKAEMKKPSG
ncbi:MAG TPA: hypothetical protein VLZ28_08045 [Daejeonella sp.]|nr:hypothetical protein [Daejeonella sp.]